MNTAIWGVINLNETAHIIICVRMPMVVKWLRRISTNLSLNQIISISKAYSLFIY